MKTNNIPTDTITYSAAISACEKGEGLLQEALRLLDEMKKTSIAPNTSIYSAAISACEKGKEGQWQEALRLLDEIESMNLLPRENTIASIIDFHEFSLSLCKVYLRKYMMLVRKSFVRLFIVGKGKHSLNGPVLKEGVLEFLNKDFSHIILKCEEDSMNAGMLNITYQSD